MADNDIFYDGDDYEDFAQYYNYVHGAFIGGLARRGKKAAEPAEREEDTGGEESAKEESASTLEPEVREAFKDLQAGLKWEKAAETNGAGEDHESDFGQAPSNNIIAAPDSDFGEETK